MDLHAFDFVETDLSQIPGGKVVAMFGDDSFLKGMVLKHLQRCLLDEDDALTVWEGRHCEWRDVADELFTVSLFGSGGRCVLIREADEFVSAHRQRLEEYVAHPSKSGTLVLDVKTWPKNTRLAKSVLKSGITVECRPPMRTAGRRAVTDRKRLVDWILQRARRTHEFKLQRAAAEQLLDLSGEHFGLLDQELAKLSLYFQNERELTADDVVVIVGGWRTQTTWELLDAVCDGNAESALVQLDRLLLAGEHPLALLGAFSWSLRRFVIATRFVEQQELSQRRVDLNQALVEAGFSKYGSQLPDAQRRLKQIGRVRADSLLRWLLEADAQMKGTHSSPERARYVLERLVLRLCRHTAPARPVAS